MYAYMGEGSPQSREECLMLSLFPFAQSEQSSGFDKEILFSSLFPVFSYLVIRAKNIPATLCQELKILEVRLYDNLGSI